MIYAGPRIVLERFHSKHENRLRPAASHIMLAVRRHDGSVFILSSPAAVARRPVPGSIRFRNAAACKQVCIPFYEQPDPLHSLDAAQARSFRNLPGIHQVIP